MNPDFVPAIKNRVIYSNTDGPSKGFIYSAIKTSGSEGTHKKLHDLKKSEKDGIISRNIAYQDPLEEYGYREIPYSTLEIDGFERFLVSNLNRLKKINDYSINNARGKDGDRDERITITGGKTFEVPPREIWEDPFYFLDNDFKNLVKNFEVVNQLLREFLPFTTENDLSKRKVFTRENVIFMGTMAGIQFVFEKKIGKNISKPDYTVFEFRLSDVTPEQDLLDKEKNKNLKEDISSVDEGEFMALLEDRLRFNVLLLPKQDFYIIGCIFFNT